MSTLAPPEQPVNPLALLDHRTRSRVVPRRLARRGPHLVLDDGSQRRYIALEGKLTHIGRGVSSDIRIEDQAVSQSHAIIVRHGRYARVLDNRSATGTYLNGRRVVATNLHSGDVICIGSVVMQYIEID
jgi:pSer/pThr/pTyr-binding forkhead associated (FHA) protein